MELIEIFDNEGESMMINNRLKDVRELIRKLDITPTMYRNAESKYKAIAKFFQENGLECDIYPQGSFAYGTVVRAYRDGKDENYDLDFICLIKVNKSETTAEEVKLRVGELLKGHGVYSKIMKEYDKCWTLNFAEGFNIDIIPAAEESLVEHLYSFITKERIAITNKVATYEYSWLLSNPKGYTEWFKYINKDFLEYSRNRRLNEFSILNKSADNKVDEIPEFMERSSLQRVIQIMKRHRDIYFYHSRKESKKPISAIITTICAEIAVEAPKHLDVMELLEYVANEFGIYSKRKTLNQEDFDKRYKNKTVIKKSKDNWEIINPVNPEDNLADQWNEDPEKAEIFFKWVEVMKKDLVDTKDRDDIDFINGLERGLGKGFVEKSINKSLYKIPQVKEVAVNKPWRKYGR